MQESLSDILENLLGLLLLEGSYDVEETEESFNVTVDTPDAGKLIGFRGESLESLQLIVNQILSRKNEGVGYKRVVLDVAGWRKQKEEELVEKSKVWAEQVINSGEDLELEPMSPWQRRVIHMTIEGIEGLVSESIGEGRERHLVIHKQ